MTKCVFLISFLFVSSVFAMEGFPEGEFSGTGVKRFPDGQTKTYEVKMKSSASRLDFTYLFPGIDPIGFYLQMTFEKNGFFKIGTLGSGYCGEKSCHWQVKLAEDDTEEWTLFFVGDRVEKLGSREHGDQKNYWEESLVKK